MKKPIDFSERVYRAMLRAYPEDYRAEYGEEMARLFRDLCRDAAERRGILGLFGAWAFIVRDLTGSLIREHAKNLSPGAVLSTLLSLSAQGVLCAGILKLTSLPLTEGQLIIGILCTLAVSLQLIILSVLTAPPKAGPGPVKEQA